MGRDQTSNIEHRTSNIERRRSFSNVAHSIFDALTHAVGMGAFYGNITLKGPDQQRSADALRGRRAIVAPKLGDYTVAWDSVCDDQDIDAIQALTSRLSRELHCVALAAIVHDDDVFGYFLYQSGELTDGYNSAPSYFDFGSTNEPAGPAGGNAELLCAFRNDSAS